MTNQHRSGALSVSNTELWALGWSVIGFGTLAIGGIWGYWASSALPSSHLGNTSFLMGFLTANLVISIGVEMAAVTLLVLDRFEGWYRD